MTRVEVEPSRGAVYWGEESDHQTAANPVKATQCQKQLHTVFLFFSNLWKRASARRLSERLFPPNGTLLRRRRD